jgi:hypothetical protein
MSNALVQLFGLLDKFVEVNVCANWEPLNKDYMFILESTSPLAAALALNCVWAEACQRQGTLMLAGSNRGMVKDVSRAVVVEVEAEAVVPKVQVAP